MGNSKSIGSLFIDIAARTAQLETDMGKVRAILQDVGKDTKVMGDLFGGNTSMMEGKVLKFSAALLGAQSLLRVLARDIRDVIEKIETIPGIPQATLESIQHMRHDLLKAKIGFEQAVAEIATFVYKASRAMGAIGAGVVAALSGQDPRESLQEFFNTKQGALDPNQIAKDQMGEIAFNEKLKAVKESLWMSEEKARRADMDEGQKAQAMWYDYLALQKKVDDFKGDEIKKTQLQIEANNAYYDAVSKMHKLQEDIGALDEHNAELIKTRNDIFIPTQDRLNNLLERELSTRQKMALLVDSTGQVKVGMESEYIALLREDVRLNAQVNDAMRRNGDLYKMLGDSIAGNFTEAILQAKNLRTALKDLAKDLEAILLREMVTKPLAGYIAEGMATLFAFADGGEPPVGKASIVGEEGPELFVPKTAGTIIPNNTAFGGSSKTIAGGNTFYIDARSADQQGLMALASQIRALNGSIERRAVNAVFNSNSRRP